MQHVLRLGRREHPPAAVVLVRAQVVDAGVQQLVLQQTRVGQAVLAGLVVACLARRVDGTRVLLPTETGAQGM